MSTWRKSKRRGRPSIKALKVNLEAIADKLLSLLRKFSNDVQPQTVS
jgi:hypothetical protein